MGVPSAILNYMFFGTVIRIFTVASYPLWEDGNHDQLLVTDFGF